MPFEKLASSCERVLGMIARSTARAVERVRYAKAVREKAIFDEAVGALRYSYFVDRLAAEFERSRRYGEPLALLLLEVLGWEAIPRENREPLKRTLAQFLRTVLRNVDVVYLYKDERSFVATLPHTTPEGAERARDRVGEELLRFPIEPYRRKGPLEYAIGVASQTAEMRSPADLAVAAENRAASPIREAAGFGPEAPSTSGPEAPMPSAPAELERPT
jgi:GGDEF domain-containing protein